MMTEAQVGQSRGQVTTARVEGVEIRPGWMKTTMKWTLGTPSPSTSNLPLHRSHARAPVPEPRLPGRPSQNQMSRNLKIHKTATVFVIDSTAEENTGIDATVLTGRTLEGDTAKATWTPHQRPSGMYCHLSLVAPLAHHTGPGRPRGDTTNPRSLL